METLTWMQARVCPRSASGGQVSFLSSHLVFGFVPRGWVSCWPGGSEIRVDRKPQGSAFSTIRVLGATGPECLHHRTWSFLFF